MVRLRHIAGLLILNPVAALHYAEHVHIAQTRTRIPTPYFCIVQEFEAESVAISKC